MTLRIEQIAAKADRAGRHLILFADGTTMRLYRQTVEDFGLYRGLELTQEQLAQLRNAAGQMSAKMRAVRIVSASSVSRRDLQERLVHKGESEEQAAQAVAWMEDLHLIDDRETAAQVVSKCIRSGYGKARAKQALYEKKIPREYWEEALSDYPDQLEKIEAFLCSRLHGEWDQKQLKRTVDALIRRGHSYAVIQRALRQMELDMEDFPEE